MANFLDVVEKADLFTWQRQKVFSSLSFFKLVFFYETGYGHFVFKYDFSKLEVGENDLVIINILTFIINIVTK